MLENANHIEFLESTGAFRLINPTNIYELYFPLCNESGLMSCVTPMLHGDIKTDQHHFITPPVTVEDLHNTKSARNFWLYIQGKGPFSVTGNSSRQNSLRFTDADKTQRTIEAGPLWHKLIFSDDDLKIRCEILQFVPVQRDKVEIMKVSINNEGDEPLTFIPTSAIPLYGRSAENIRDHRQVTSLVNRVEILDYGITVKPEIIFDERGHKYNDVLYYIAGVEDTGRAPLGSIPSVHDFIGERGTLEWPEAVVRNLSPEKFNLSSIQGKEYVGALRFN